MTYILKLLKNNFLLTLLSFMKSKNWVNRQKNDQFVKKAKQLGATELLFGLQIQLIGY